MSEENKTDFQSLNEQHEELAIELKEARDELALETDDYRFCNKFLRKLNELELASDTLDEQYKRRKAALANERKAMYYMQWARFKHISCMQIQGGPRKRNGELKKKSFDFEYGRVKLAKTREKVEILDEKKLHTYLLTHWPNLASELFQSFKPEFIRYIYGAFLQYFDGTLSNPMEDWKQMMGLIDAEGAADTCKDVRKKVLLEQIKLHEGEMPDGCDIRDPQDEFGVVNHPGLSARVNDVFEEMAQLPEEIKELLGMKGNINGTEGTTEADETAKT